MRTATSLSKHLTRVLQVYERAGFKVRTILMDGEFEKVRNLMPCVECNTTAAKEHVSKAERTIRTIKERTRGLLGTLPFQHVHLFHGFVGKRFSSEERYLIHVLTERTPGEMALGLYKALQGATGNILRGP